MLLALAAILGVVVSELAVLKRGAEAPQVVAAPAVAAPAAPVEPVAPAAAAPKAEQVEIYCVKCRERRMISDPERVTLSSGHPALQGHCPVCGTKVNRIVKAGAAK